jgi:hypothetical protein
MIIRKVTILKLLMEYSTRAILIWMFNNYLKSDEEFILPKLRAPKTNLRALGALCRDVIVNTWY